MSPWRGMCALLPLGLLAMQATAQDSVSLTPLPEGHNMRTRALGDGVYEVTVLGEDPYVQCERLTDAFDHERLSVLSFEYVCPEGLDHIQIFFGWPPTQEATYTHRDLAPATDWAPFVADLSEKTPEWDASVRDFRLDFGSGGEVTLRIRNLCLRALTDEELAAKEERAEAERAARERLCAEIRSALPAPANIPEGNVVADTVLAGRGGNATATSVLGRDLDLPSLLRRHVDAANPAATLGPALVVGEGPDPLNHTLVRLLNEYGVCDSQFLAYPPEVLGGVLVRTGAGVIVASPLADASIREIRLFDANGNRVGGFEAPAELAPPFTLAVGAFLGGPGDQIAIASAHAGPGEAAVVVVSRDGTPLARTEVRMPVGSRGLRLSTDARAGGRARLLAYPVGSSGFVRLDLEEGRQEWIEAGLGETATGVYASSAAGWPYVATTAGERLSELERVGAGGRCETVNVGARENLFWFTNGGWFASVPEGQYTRHAGFDHIRCDFASPVVSDPDFTRTDPDYWAGPGFMDFARARLANYDTALPTCWEPCFTHRWFAGQARKWAEATDPETGLPSYVLLDRENKVGYYGEFGETNAFVTGSYAPENAPVEALYTYPLRAFLRELASRFDRNPEHFVAVEPNHEMEINAETETTHGDYNPNMLRAFHRYLVSLYGSLDGVNATFGTDFGGEWFDAPRNLGRGDWDAYSTENPYYMVWMRFQNYVIYRVVAGTYREALLAGFPPEAVRCHQIPDHYAIASLTAFSKPAARITPIDWNLNAGVGFGFTKYGVWYNQEHNPVQGPHSSGFDLMLIGEYQSLHPDPDVAYAQLAYMRDHGVEFIHNMNWPEGHDRGYNAALRDALQRLVADDRPRPGITAGTGEVHAATLGDRSFDIVSLGTGPQHTGLLKSVAPDGSWDGTVYVVPFHAHVDVEMLESSEAPDLAGAPVALGPFPRMTSGQLVEVSMWARGDGSVRMRVFHEGIELPAQTLEVPVGPEWRHIRLLLRVQITTDAIRLELGADGGVEARDLLATLQSERTLKLKEGVFEGRRHQGGVTFDLLREEQR